jgi:2-oxoglutarate dehydrogenase E1 component
MSRQDANAAFANTAFLYGGNAAYIEDLQARYEADPTAVDAQWQAFFQSLKNDRADSEKSPHGPSWKRSDWPPPARDELVAALGGDWSEVERSVGDKLKSRAQGRGVELVDAIDHGRERYG